MFANIFDKLWESRKQTLRENYASAAEVQRIFDGCLDQGLDSLEAVGETEILMNISHLTVSDNRVAAYRVK